MRSIPLLSLLNQGVGKSVVTLTGFVSRWGAGAGSDYQDSAQALPGASILDSLSRTVLVVTTHSSCNRTLCTPFRIHFSLVSHKAEGMWCLSSGPCETGSRARAPMDGFTACPELRHHIPLAPTQVAKLGIAGAMKSLLLRVTSWRPQF